MRVKIIIILSLFFYFATVLPAQAGVNSFFSSGLSGSNTTATSSGAGVFHAQGENIYTLGYSNVRFGAQSQNVALFAIAPPTFSIGCSGISAQWGAFAIMVNHLMKVLSALIQSGELEVFAFNMVLGVLCKQCQTIMNQLETIANKLNSLNFNSCRTAQAMGNIAGAEIGKMIGQGGAAGATNAFADNVSKTLGNVSGTVNKFVNTINGISNGSCASTAAGATALVASNFSSCGDKSVIKKFSQGSFLREALKHAKIGLINGTLPGSGGENNMIAMLRGTFVGDIVGYFSASKGNASTVSGGTPGVGYPVLKYIGPKETNSGSANVGNANISSVLYAFMHGSKNLTSITIDYPSAGIPLNTPTSLGDIESVDSSMCFPGFDAIFNYYLGQIEHSYFPSVSAPSFANICGGSTSSSTDAQYQLTSQQMDNFITDNPLPVLLILKLAYVTDSHAIINSAAKSMASGYVYNIFSSMMKSVENNILSNKNLSHTRRDKILATYVHQVSRFKKALKNRYITELAVVNSETNNLKYYQNLNKQWVSSLASYGLAGGYNFNP